jgi:hypothetical protein
MKSFQEFYPFYLREHSTPVCRGFHYVGTTGVIAVVAAVAVSARIHLLALIPVVGYGFAWTGHFVFEKNRPATFKHPLWSLRADFVMYFEWLSGRLARSLTNAGVSVSTPKA